MLHGDISNRAGVTIAFRCEDFLIVQGKSSLLNKALGKIFSGISSLQFNPTVYSAVERLFRNSSYNVDLVIERPNMNRDVENLLSSAPFSRLLIIDRVSEISKRLVTGDIAYYVDDDSYRRNLVNSRFAVTLEQLQKLVKV